MKNDWKFLSERTVFEDRIIKVRHQDYSYAPVSEQMTFTLVDISSWVLIVPRTVDGDFLIVKQFRAGNADDTLEFPGGAIDKDEQHALAAARELVEETGATATNFQLLCVMEPNPAFMTNKCYVYLADNADITTEPKRDKFEDTETIRVSEQQLRQMIKNGEFRQSLSIAAFGLLQNNL